MGEENMAIDPKTTTQDPAPIETTNVETQKKKLS